jgi:hypothetical protein
MAWWLVNEAQGQLYLITFYSDIHSPQQLCPEYAKDKYVNKDGMGAPCSSHRPSNVGGMQCDHL